MRKASKHQLCLTGRDYDILQFLFKNKVATLEQVHKYFFEGRRKQVSSQRLGKLSQHKLIHKKAIFIDNYWRRVFSISEKGIKMISEFLAEDVDSKRYVSDSIYHDLILTDITKRFEEFSVVDEVLSEAQLLSCSGYMKSSQLLPFIELKSDRVCITKGSNGDTSYAALEFERTLKKYSRNRAKLESYYLSHSVPAVFYICSSPSLMRSLMKVDEKLCKNQESKVYFCLLSDVQKESDHVTFTRFDGEQLTFR